MVRPQVCSSGLLGWRCSSMQFAAQALLLPALLPCLLPCLDDLLRFGSPAFAVGGSGLKVGGVEVTNFEVPFAHIFVAKGWTSSWSFSFRQLAKKEVFGDSSIVHADDMPQPSHVSGCEDKKHARQSGNGQDDYASNTVLPGEAKESAEAT